MFQFKGAAEADASRDRGERDWRVTDHYNIQNLGRRPFTTMLLPTLHQRSLTEDSKRPDLPPVRSRSNSSTASHSAYDSRKPSLTPSFERSTPRSSIDRRSVSGLSIHARAGSTDSFGKSLMAKGSRLLRRQNSKQDDLTSLTSLQTLDWLEDTKKKAQFQEVSNEANARYSRSQSDGDAVSPRWNISEPFNFQHLTHTTPQHVEKIQKTSHGDLVSEFSAIRAAQQPRRELRGIKAVNIQQGIYFSENSASETSSPPQTGYANSPPRSPSKDQDHDQGRREEYFYKPPSPVRDIPRKGSIENFSQPSPRYHTAQSSPISPPPRTSSRHFAPDFFTFHQESPTDTSFDPHLTTDDPAPPDLPRATWQDDLFDDSLPHAVTTPDDTALPIRPPPFIMVRTELPGVPEEDETSEGKRSSIATSNTRPTTPTSSIRHAKSFPSIKSSPRRQSDLASRDDEEDDHWLPRQRINSVSFVLPGEEEHREEVPSRPRVSKRISLRKEESWEDVIDYCYEHEAEADCNFEWDMKSSHQEEVDIPTESTLDTAQSTTTIQPRTAVPANPNATPPHHANSHRRSSSVYSNSPPPLLPLQTFLPDLVPPASNSVESSFSSISEAITPLPTDSNFSTKLPTSINKHWAAPPVVSPMVVQDESGSDPPFDDLYRHMLVHSSEQQLFTTGRVDGSIISNSPRSSRSPISKSSSQESFWFSQANAAAARRHRNTGSVGSLPELIQSRSNDKPEIADAQAADQITSLNISDANIPADGPQHRRSPSLAKEAALKSMLAKVGTTEERDIPEVPLPIHPAFRDRANSDAVVLDTPVPPVQPPLNFARRMRSTSSASSLNARKVNRGSYSLFPPPAVR